MEFNQQNNKILFVVTSFPSVTETFIINQIADLIDRGFQVTVFAYNKSKIDIQHKIYKDYQLEKCTFFHFKNEKSIIKIVFYWLSFFFEHLFKINYKLVLSCFNPFQFSTGVSKIKALYDLPIFMINQHFDIIHCHFGFNGKKISKLSSLGIIKHSKLVLSFHGSDLTPSRIQEYKTLYKPIFECFNAYTINTLFLKEIVLKINPKLKNLFILPVGFKEEYLKSYLNSPKNEQLFPVIFIGRFIELKGPLQAIKIVESLYSKGIKNCCLHMVGDGELKEELHSYVRQNKLEKIVFFHGQMGQEDVFKLLASSAVFLLPGITDLESGRAETQGLVIQEAQYLKVPVVVSDVGGIKYGLLNNSSGFLINSTDIPTFVAKIEQLYFDKELRKTVGENGHYFVKENYTSKKLGDQLIKIYAGL